MCADRLDGVNVGLEERLIRYQMTGGGDEKQKSVLGRSQRSIGFAGLRTAAHRQCLLFVRGSTPPRRYGRAAGCISISNLTLGEGTFSCMNASSRRSRRSITE